MQFDISGRIDVHHHHHGSVAEIGEVLHKLAELSAQLKKGLLMVRQDIVDFSKKVDASTTAIGDRIQKLIDASTTLNADEKAELQRLSDHLDSIARDPENPTPPLPPV